VNEDHFTFLIISCSVLLRMRNVSDIRFRENHNTHFVFNYVFFLNRVVYEIMWKNIAEPDRPQMTIWRMRISCCVANATNTQSECAILTAFPLQQWLHEQASMLRDSTLPVLFNSIINPQDKYTILSSCPIHTFWLGASVGSLR